VGGDSRDLTQTNQNSILHKSKYIDHAHPQSKAYILHISSGEYSFDMDKFVDYTSMRGIFQDSVTPICKGHNNVKGSIIKSIS